MVHPRMYVVPDYEARNIEKQQQAHISRELAKQIELNAKNLHETRMKERVAYQNQMAQAQE